MELTNLLPNLLKAVITLPCLGTLAVLGLIAYVRFTMYR